MIARILDDEVSSIGYRVLLTSLTFSHLHKVI